MRDVVIDTDLTWFGDDALAVAFLLHDPTIRVRALVTTSGNAWVEQVTADALSLLEQLGQPDVPVFAGAGEPLSKPLEAPTNMVGGNFLGAFSPDKTRGTVEPVGGWSGSKAQPQSAVDYLRAFDSGAGSAASDLLLLGPATNLALALRADPTLASRLGRVYVLGGALAQQQELNFWFDSEAIREVLARVPALILVPADLGMREQVSLAGLQAPDPASPLGRYLTSVIQHRVEKDQAEQFPSWDVVLAACLATEFATAEVVQAGVQVTPRGETRIVAGQGTTGVVTSVKPGTVAHWIRSVIEQGAPQ